jgi:hypothetical protein
MGIDVCSGRLFGLTTCSSLDRYTLPGWRYIMNGQQNFAAALCHLRLDPALQFLQE